MTGRLHAFADIRGGCCQRQLQFLRLFRNVDDLRTAAHFFVIQISPSVMYIRKKKEDKAGKKNIRDHRQVNGARIFTPTGAFSPF